MTERPLSPLMKKVVVALLEAKDGSLTGNGVGMAVGAKTVEGGGSGAKSQGSGHRVFGPAQRVLFPLKALEERGLVAKFFLDDSTYFCLTDGGQLAAETLKREEK